MIGNGAPACPSRNVRVDCEVMECLIELKYHFSELTSKLCELILAYLRRNPFTQKRKRNEFILTLSTFLGKESHRYPKFCKMYDELVAANDMFQIKIFKLFVQHYFKNHPSYLTSGKEYIRFYECKKDSFMHTTTLKNFRNAVLEAVPHGLTETRYDYLTLTLSEDWSNCVLKALEHLVFKVFGVHKSVFLDIKISYGSVVVLWKFIAHLRPVLVDSASKNLDVLKENNVIKLLIGTETLYSRERPQEVRYIV